MWNRRGRNGRLGAERAYGAAAPADTRALEAIPADVDALVPFAERHRSDAARALRYRLEGPDAGRWRARALALLERARDAVDAVPETHRDHERASRLRRGLVFLIQTCSKDMAFFD